MLAMLRLFAQNIIEEYPNIPEITDKANELLITLDQAEALKKELIDTVLSHDPKIAQLKEDLAQIYQQAIEERNKNLN